MGGAVAAPAPAVGSGPAGAGRVEPSGIYAGYSLTDAMRDPSGIHRDPSGIHRDMNAAGKSAQQGVARPEFTGPYQPGQMTPAVEQATQSPTRPMQVIAQPTSDGQGDRRSWFNILSPWIYRAGNALGLDELWGWAWTLVHGERRAHDDTSFALAANLFTTRTRKDHTQSSVPFLFNYESDARGSTLRLFQFIPIPFGSGTAQEDSPR